MRCYDQIFLMHVLCNLLEKLLQLIGSIKRTIFRKVGTETILKIYNTVVLPTSLYGSEN